MNYRVVIVVVVVLLVVVGLYFILPTLMRGRGEVKVEGGALKSIIIRSEAFENGSYIPEKYSLEGGNISPPLEWSNVPEGTMSFVLIVVDPDAPMGQFTHWILYNIPGETRSIPENIPKTLEVEGLGFQGYNDYGKVGYGGPHPPRGSTHRYIFRIYALDKKLDLKPGATLEEILREMEGHVIAYGELVGLYSR